MEDEGLDQKTLAARTGLNVATISKVYWGQFNRIGNSTVTTLCLYFGLKTISDLIDIEWEKDDIEGAKQL